MVFGRVETVQKPVVAGLVDEFWLEVNLVATGRCGALFDDGTLVNVVPSSIRQHLGDSRTRVAVGCAGPMP